MGQKVTIGGDRLGAGHKMQTELHNYGMSTHNLSTKFRSTMGAGILYPSLVLLGERDDHFKIKLDQDIRTKPTVAPLFGSFKLQTDVFMVPIRLYQGLLHNNPTELGKQMAQVKLPKVEIGTMYSTSDPTSGGFSQSCLMKYLGASGIGRGASGGYIKRRFNAVPMLAYYDIFKCYYANKQEENAYVISALNKVIQGDFSEPKYKIDSDPWRNSYMDGNDKAQFYINWALASVEDSYITLSVKTSINEDTFNTYENDIKENMKLAFFVDSMYTTKTIADLINESIITSFSLVGDTIQIQIGAYALTTYYEGEDIATDRPTTLSFDPIKTSGIGDLNLTPFELKNIDRMRYDILKENELGVTFLIQRGNTYMPYLTNVEVDSNVKTLNRLPLTGLCVKTYQNDLFNNWINSEWIDGENGVAELSKILVEDGAIKIDALQFAKKVYNLYNRISISGATYYEWQNVVWSESKQSHVESPVYVGGYASEVMFEEIVQTTPSEIDGDFQALGNLGGKGVLVGKKGGYIEVDCEEACFIIAITSLTPRVSYYQGNEFYMTELDSIDDLHKPEFDGIGFQDLLGERLAFFDTRVDANGDIKERTKIGKVPAWIEYQTNVDRTFGEFADENKAGYMVLTRKYEHDTNGKIKDVTTYIDPSQYNYAFATINIDAQNFWLEAIYDIQARRRMSAHLIPQA